jgi:hypothetical protein
VVNIQATQMRTNSDVTIWNKYRVANIDTWQRVVVPDVAWEQRHARSQFDSDDLATVYIPMARDEDYLSPRVWQALSDKSSNWTIQVGDVIAKGSISQALTAGIYTLSNLKAAYDDVLVITAVDTYDYGSANMQHYRIGAK